MIVDTYEVRPMIKLPGGAKVVGLLPHERGYPPCIVVEYPEPGNGSIGHEFRYLAAGDSYAVGSYVGHVPGRGLLYWIN